MLLVANMLFAASFDVFNLEDDAVTKVLVACNNDVLIVIVEVLDEGPTSLGHISSSLTPAVSEFLLFL